MGGGYNRSNGAGWADTDTVNITDPVTLTATASTTPIEPGDRGTLRLLLTVSAASGTTPTLDVSIETSFDGQTGWRSMGAFTQATAAGSQRKSFSGADRFVRATATIGGTTPSFTFSVNGEAV
jgi:hypothetical protein